MGVALARFLDFSMMKRSSLRVYSNSASRSVSHCLRVRFRGRSYLLQRFDAYRSRLSPQSVALDRRSRSRADEFARTSGGSNECELPEGRADERDPS
jgi:hypothetical protein